MSEVTKELLELVWGTKSSPGLSDTIFCRWTQGTGTGLAVPAAPPGRPARSLPVSPLPHLGYLALGSSALLYQSRAWSRSPPLMDTRLVSVP